MSEGECSDLCVKRVSLGFLCERVAECEGFVGSEMKFRVKRSGTRENSSAPGFGFLRVFNGLKGDDRDGYFGVSEVKWVAVKAVVSVMEVGWDRCAILRVWMVREEIGGH